MRASYKNIFRSPTFNESYYYHYGSTDLAPEVTDQVNVGITMDEGRMTKVEGTHVRVTLDGYYNRLRDMIVSVPYNMFIWSCINVGKVRILGLDATLNVTQRLGSGHQVMVTGNYSYQRAQNRTNPESPNYNKQIAYMPEHSWAAAVNYENPWVNVSIHGHGVTARWPNNDHYEGTMIDGYKEFGLTAYRAFSWGRHRLEGRVDVKNLFNEQYELVGHYPMPGRSWQLSILYKF